MGRYNAPIDKWMSLPELGHIIATAYNIVFVSYGIHVGYTFLPIIVDDDIESPTRTLIIGFIHQARHFIALRMCNENDYPLPDVPWYWAQERDSSTADLVAPYMTRFEESITLMNSRKKKDQHAHINVNDNDN
ncbi:hypothetical protein LIER_22191 [Lithospermum erythrorhizon]|uniref:Uncharacterized protein n=1 Tax=Lithospermum erythrorhizon TaxID=34254 RepID=A0AAV3QX65_LITER